jgi:putative transposase
MPEAEDTGGRLLRRYTFKMYPNRAQSDALDATRRAHCRLYNAALQERIDAYRLAGRTLTFFDQCKSLKYIRADDPAYAAMSAGSLAETLRRVSNAFDAFFRRAKQGRGAASGFPRYQRSADYPSIPYREAGHGWHLDADARRARFKGIPGSIRLRGRFPLAPQAIRNCDLVLRAGVWWFSVVVEMTPRLRRDDEQHCEIAFDLVDSFADVTFADGGYAAGSEGAVSAASDDRISPHRQEQSDAGGMHPQRVRSLNERREAVGLPTVPLVRSPDERGEAVGITPSEAREREARSPDERGEAVGISRCRRGSARQRRLKRLLARKQARAARQRRGALHRWTTAIARRTASLTITAPASLPEITASGRGDARRWGAAVRIKAEFNRHVLDQTPGLAIAMLAYKLAERGGAVAILDDAAPKAAIGNSVVTATKENRKLKRTIAHASRSDRSHRLSEARA